MHNQTIKIIYLHHSSFLIETEKELLVFDYYAGPLNRDIFKTQKDVFVFVTHSHGDHFNPEIFNWQRLNTKINYVLSDDIEAYKNLNHCHYMQPHESLQVNNITIKSFGSTDQGVSYLVELDNFTIFHAGDLNWWHWKEFTPEQLKTEEVDFKKEVEYLKEFSIDIAFVPVDPRLEEFYYLAGKYFAEEVQPKTLIPMHFRDNYFISSKFADKIKDLDVNAVELTHMGQEFYFEK